MANVTYPNGLQSVFAYDSLNRVTGLATQVSGYVYQLGPTGNRTSALELNGRTINWSYDGINRLTQETIASAPSGKNGTVSYGLDPVGNRLSDSSTLPGIASTAASFDADDRLSSETYDSNGNTLTTGGKSFTFDSENHLTSMNSGTVSIDYDGDGNRVAKTVGGITTRYLVDNLNPTGRVAHPSWCPRQPNHKRGCPTLPGFGRVGYHKGQSCFRLCLWRVARV